MNDASWSSSWHRFYNNTEFIVNFEPLNYAHGDYLNTWMVQDSVKNRFHLFDNHRGVFINQLDNKRVGGGGKIYSKYRRVTKGY